MKYKLIIFDFDGTLADSFQYFLRTMNALAATYKFPVIPAQEVDQLRGLDARQMIKRAQLPAWKIPLIARAFIRRMGQDIDQIHLFEGISHLLSQLASQGVNLAIVSSNSEQNIRRVLGPTRASLISHYGCGSSLFSKQRKFQRAMVKMGAKPQETLCVGDEVRDLEAAQAANLTFGGVTWGYTRPDALGAYPGIRLFHSPNDILREVLDR